jgi:hypothetical protein
LAKAAKSTYASCCSCFHKVEKRRRRKIVRYISRERLIRGRKRVNRKQREALLRYYSGLRLSLVQTTLECGALLCLLDWLESNGGGQGKEHLLSPRVYRYGACVKVQYSLLLPRHCSPLFIIIYLRRRPLPTLKIYIIVQLRPPLPMWYAVLLMMNVRINSGSDFIALLEEMCLFDWRLNQNLHNWILLNLQRPWKLEYNLVHCSGW